MPNKLNTVMRNIQNRCVVLILGLAIISNMAFSIEAGTTHTYYTKGNCKYDVYVANAGGTVGCNDWTYINQVTSSNEVSVHIGPGENKLIRIVHGGFGVCEGSKQKRQDNVSVRSNANKNHTNRYELHDFSCN